MDNRLIVPAGVLMAAVLIIAGGYMILNKDKPTESPGNIDDTEPYVENTTGTASVTLSMNIAQNTKPSFKVEDRFVYEGPVYPAGSSNCRIEHVIVDKVRVNGTEYFRASDALLEACVIMIEEKPKGLVPIPLRPYNETRLYINVDTGQQSYQLGTKDAVTLNASDPRLCAESGDWFCTWMLLLDDNFKWQAKSVDEYGSELYDGYSYTFEESSVEGREKIDGRECFKVNHESKICLKDGSCIIDFKKIYYIDVEKRILLKRDAWQGNLYMGEIKLVDQNVWKTGK